MKYANQTTADAHDSNCCDHVNPEKNIRLCCGRDAGYGCCNEIHEDHCRVW